MTYKIEDDVPMPTDRREPVTKYPFRDMKVGQSFAIPADKRGAVCTAAFMHGKKFGVKFSTRKIDENTCRIWRIA